MPRTKVSTASTGSDAEEHADFDTVVSGFQGTKVASTDKIILYFIVALFVTSLPVYLYWAVFDLTLMNFGMVFLPVTILASLLLTFAYRNWAINTYATLLSARKANPKLSKSTKGKADMEQVTVNESIVWSFFINNLLFFALFLFIAFYALKTLASSYSYTLSMIMTSAVVWQLSSSVVTPVA